MQQDQHWKAEVRQTFGHRIRKIRTDQGISQEALALRCGLDRSYLGQVERGERNITLENIYRLAAGLGVTADTLFVSTNATQEDQGR